MKAIVAMDPNRVIGNKGKIPWHISEDFKWFKQCTLDQSIVVGFRTFAGLPKLRDRNVFVLDCSATACYNAGFTIKNKQGLEGILEPFRPDFPPSIEVYSKWERWVCGGAKTYSLLLPYCNEIYVTHVLDKYEGDTFMPPFEHLMPNSKILREEKDFRLVKYWVTEVEDLI